MRKGIICVLVVLILTLTFGFATAGIPIDISSSTFQVNGAETMTINNVSVLGGSYWLQFQWNQNTYKLDLIGYGQETPLTNAEKLLGNWTFQYTIASTYTKQYSLTTVDSTEVNEEGGYLVSGVDQYGDPVTASHLPDSRYYTLLDQGISYDYFFTFTITGNSASGCYYLINKTEGTTSACYRMSGSKTALTSSNHNSNSNLKVGVFLEEIEAEEAGEETMDPIHKMQYDALKSLLSEQ